MRINKILLLAGIILLAVPQALAYIDPGTGGIILGSIWPYIVMIAAAIGGVIVKVFFRPIKKLFTNSVSLFKRK